MSLSKYTSSTLTYDVSIPRERVIQQNCNIPAGYRRLSCYFANTAENGVYFKVGEEGAKTIALGGPLTEDTIVGNTETNFSIAIGTGDYKKGGAGFIAIEKLDDDGKLPKGFPLRDFFTITDPTAFPGTQKVINDEGAVLYVSKFENDLTRGQFAIKTVGLDSEGTLNVLNTGQPAIYSTDITTSYESDAYSFLAVNNLGNPATFGTAGKAGIFVSATSAEDDAVINVLSRTQDATKNAITTVSAEDFTTDIGHSLVLQVNAGVKNFNYSKVVPSTNTTTPVYSFPTPNTSPGANQMLITDSNSVLQFSDIQAVLALVPAYVDNATATGAGLAVGATYYNTTSNTYTRVV
jgi:hypothetical protein